MTSHISSDPGGTTFSGPEAVRLYQAMVIRSALGLAQKGIRVNRHVGPTALLRNATHFTGQKYKARAYAQAIADLTTWIDQQKEHFV